jgi:diguanylate cyclase (GGDEF)-like protein
MVNDSLGHAAGDHLLLIVARRLEGCLRAEDLVAHYGKSQSIARMPGDKFAVFIEDIGHVSDAIHIATRIQNVLREPFSLAAREIYLTTSIGMTLSATDYRCPEDVVRDAESALHRAKAHGSARYEIFDTAMHGYATARLQVETELHYAIEREELRVFYQPIVSLGSGHIYGFEALMRWQHPQRGLIAPEAFIAVAEETGLIIPMGAWILREACRQIQDWQTQLALPSRLQLNVNLCGKEFLAPNLVTQVASILHETGFTASCLTLEITESVLMGDAEAAAHTLTRLRDLGPKIAIDDFGTGYCSLSYLHTFPLDFLKVDRSFVSNMSTGTTNPEIVRAIITLAHAIGLEVVAEGLEMAEDIERLQDLGCEYGQGFFFAKPLDADAAEVLLCHQPSRFIQHV